MAANAPRLLLMGCGAVGGVIAGSLKQLGHQLFVVTHNETITEALRRRGLKVTTPDGHYGVLSTGANTSLDELPGPFDIVLLATKATDVENAARAVAPKLAPGGYVVTLQNGVVEDRVAAILGRERVVGGLVVWGATMHEPGVYEMTSRGETVVGELDGSLTAHTRQLEVLLGQVAPVVVSQNIYGVLWSKLAINCVITTLGAVTGQLLGEMVRQARVRRLGMAIVSEVVDAATANGIRLEKAGGTLDLQRLYLPPSRRQGGYGPDLLVKHLIMVLVGARYSQLKSSMLQSLERGRPTEIDFMNGFVMEQSAAKGLQAPVNAALTAIVKEIETGRRPIQPQNLADLPG